MIEIHIPLPPVPWQPSLKGKHGFYDPKEKEKRCVRFFLKQYYKDLPLTDFTLLHFTFYFKIPKSFTKKKVSSVTQGRLFPTRSDCTNLQKLYEDCLKGIIIDDDRKVIKITSEKYYGPRGGVSIKVMTIDECRGFVEEKKE